MECIIFKTEQELDCYVGQYLVNFIHQHSHPHLGFATGSTPLGIYDYLIKSYQQGLVDFSSVEAFNLDEYVGLEKTHPLSFAYAMKENLFQHINIKPEHIHALNGNAKNMEEECLRYEQDIKDHPIDIQILGIGMDGHIAYNEPGSPFDGGCHVVDLQRESIESSLDYGFGRIEDVPKQGVTQGIATIMQAKQLIMIAKGEKKAPLVKRMLEGEISTDFPSSIIQRHPNVLLVLDEAAASCIKR